eukprot:5907753-Pyramimonas_sp.AAC.2
MVDQSDPSLELPAGVAALTGAGATEETFAWHCDDPRFPNGSPCLAPAYSAALVGTYASEGAYRSHARIVTTN